jgi:Xaa-Pro aminopeptidase
MPGELEMMRPHRVLRPICVVLLLAAAAAAGASELSDDLSARRARMMARLDPGTMLIVMSAPSRLYSLDVDYEYRQSSNLYYLTGIAQEGTMLVLMPGNGTRREILFVKDRNPDREHWTGHLLSRDEAAARSGVPMVMVGSQFEPFLAAMLTGSAFGSEFEVKETSRFSEALAAGRARVMMPLDAGGLDAPLSPAQEFVNRLRMRYAGFQVVDATPLFTDLRLVKTPYEQKILTRATEISAEAQMAGMRSVHPGSFEYEVKAAIEAVHRGRGAISWAYPSIVGSGPNATILHYPESDRQMQSGDLLLVDAACNYGYMSPDITRTYPVSGTFTPAQREIYAIVLEAQDEAMKVARPEASLLAIHNRTVEVIKEGLLKLGLIGDTTGDQYKMWYTHGASHYIGIDVHDVGERTRPLRPGMTFVIEPGIYIRQAALDALPRTAENLALIEKIGPAVKKYADIGIRVEDSFLLEDTGLKRLSSAVPRTIAEIEAFMRQRPGSSSGDAP